MFRTILADPPWAYNDKLTMSLTPRGSEDNYSTMTLPEICALWNGTLGTLAGHELKDDAFLFLWVTNPFLLNGAGVKVCEAWNFTPKQIITWVKGRLEATKIQDSDGDLIAHAKLVLRTGLGRYTRGTTEHMILATRGRPQIFVKDQGVNNLILAEEIDAPVLSDQDTVFVASPTGHSRKPEASYQLIERVCPGPYLELFARQKRMGWMSWGNEL
jgi:N6-adenosine-specific RNA methylase IME4